MENITGEWLIEAKECFKQFHEGKTSERAFIIDLARINQAVKRKLKGDVTRTIWFRFFKNDTGATTIENIETHFFFDTKENKKYLLECIEIAVKESSLEMYYS